MENVHLVVGLGNPGAEYARTRHNVGFMVVERLAERFRARWSTERKFEARLARGEWQGQSVLLFEPLTYMNASGEAVGAVQTYYRVEPARLLVVVDDADLPLGTNRLRPEGGSGGHHGLESIERRLGTQEYARLRVGIGRGETSPREITGYVLGRFSPTEQPLLDQVLDRVARQVQSWVSAGIQKAMNEFNGAMAAPAKEVAE